MLSVRAGGRALEAASFPRRKEGRPGTGDVVGGRSRPDSHGLARLAADCGMARTPSGFRPGPGARSAATAQVLPVMPWVGQTQV